MATIFFSYSHADEEMRDELEKHLSLLKRQGRISSWHDRRIPPGDDFAKEISVHLEQADVILLLVSPDFMHSDYCYDIEMGRAMERNDEGSAIVVPVILRYCDWQSAPFGRILGCPRDGKPIASWGDRDEAFLDVVTRLKSLLPEPPRREPDKPPKFMEPKGHPTSSKVRSSNLGIKKTFSDAERDQFIEDAFEFIAEYFLNSLNELKERHDGVDFKFDRNSRTELSVRIYLNGDSASQATIALGNAAGVGIYYSDSLGPFNNSWNDQLSLVEDDGRLMLRAMGFLANGDHLMNREEAAEHFWATLVHPLQRN